MINKSNCIRINKSLTIYKNPQKRGNKKSTVIQVKKGEEKNKVTEGLYKKHIAQISK